MKKSTILVLFLMFTTIVFSQKEGPTISKKLETPKETITQILKKRASIWIDGQWKVENNQYVWEKGHWEAKRVGYVFINGNWKKKSNGWVWKEGYWKEINLEQWIKIYG